MATIMGAIGVRLTADTSNFQRGMRRSEDDLERLDRQGKRTERTIDSLGRTMMQAGNRARQFGQGLALAVTLPAAGLAGFAAKIAGEFEQTQVAFTTLMGTAREAKAFLADLYQFASTTPFEVRGLLQSARLLKAFGFEANRILPLLGRIGDAVSALGGDQETLQRVIRAIGQIQAKGKVSAEELLQLAEAGIPAYEILAEELGLTADQVADIGRQGIKANQAIDALARGLERRFGGAMVDQMDTLNGKWSNLMDNIVLTANRFGQAFLPQAKRVVDWAIDLTQNLRSLTDTQVQSALKWAAIAAAIPPVIIGIGLLIQAFGVLATVVAVVGGLISFVFSPLMLGILGLVALVGLFAATWEENWGNIQGAAETAWDRIQGIISGLRDGLSITEVTVAVGGLWALSFAQSFLAAVLAKAGITRAGIAAAGRYVFNLGAIAVTAMLVWEFVLPENIKQAVTDMWHNVARVISDAQLGPLNPFRDRVAAWLEDLGTESWQIPALTIGVTFAAFKLVQGGVRVAALLGAAVASSVGGVAIAVGVLSLAIAGFTIALLTPQQREELSRKLQETIGNPEIPLLVKISRVVFEILPEAVNAAGENSGFLPLLRDMGLVDENGNLQPALPMFRNRGAEASSAPVTGNSMDDLLEALRLAEGNPNHGLITFQGEFGSSRRNELFQQFAQGLEPGTEEWYREAARASVSVYWEEFAAQTPGAAGKTFDQVGPQIQAEFIRWWGQNWAPLGASNDPTNLNQHWIPNMIRTMGLQGFHDGALLPGRGGPDQFLAMLAPGEAVVPARAVNGGWQGVLSWFRQMGVPGFAQGFAPASTGNTQLGSFSAGGLQEMVANMERAVEGVANTMLQGITTIFEVMITVVETIGRAILGDERWAEISSTLEDARARLREFIETITGQGPRDVTPDVRANVRTEEPGGPGFLARLGGTLKDFVMGTEKIPGLLERMAAGNGTLGSAVQGFATGGPIGGILALIQNSEGFARVMEALEPIVQAVADSFGRLLEPIMPLIRVISAVLAPVLEVFGTIIQSLLLPVMPILFYALKFLGMAVLALAIGLGAVWNAIATAFNFLLGWIPGVGKLAKVDLGNLAKQFKDLADMTYEDAQAMEDHKKAVEDVTASLKNVPEGFKTALRTFQSATGARIPALASGGIVSHPTVALVGEAGPEAVVPLDQLGNTGGGAPVNVTIVSNDPEVIWRKLQPLIERRNFRSSGTPIGTTSPFATHP